MEKSLTQLLCKSKSNTITETALRIAKLQNLTVGLQQTELFRFSHDDSSRNNGVQAAVKKK